MGPMGHMRLMGREGRRVSFRPRPGPREGTRYNAPDWRSRFGMSFHALAMLVTARVTPKSDLNRRLPRMAQGVMLT
jgi:hypothetical protein